MALTVYCKVISLIQNLLSFSVVLTKGYERSNNYSFDLYHPFANLSRTLAVHCLPWWPSSVSLTRLQQVWNSGPFRHILQLFGEVGGLSIILTEKTSRLCTDIELSILCNTWKMMVMYTHVAKLETISCWLFLFTRIFTRLTRLSQWLQGAQVL